MENRSSALSLPAIDSESAEGWMLKEDEVREVLARIQRGKKIKTIARTSLGGPKDDQALAMAGRMAGHRSAKGARSCSDTFFLGAW